MLLLSAAPVVAAASGPDPVLQGLLTGGIGAALITGAYLLLQVLLNKRLRAPSDRLAEAQFSVKVYQDQVAEARADKALNEQTATTLREYVNKLEADSRSDQQLITELYKQIRALEERNDQKDRLIAEYSYRISHVANKLAAGGTITISDLTDPLAPDATYGL
jgi:chromosome segregation ATPase